MQTSNRLNQDGFKWALAVLGALAILGIAKANDPPVKTVATAQPNPFDGVPGSRSVAYSRTLMTVTNQRFGTFERGYFCSSPAPLILTNVAVNAISARFASSARQELSRLGYVDAVGEQSAFSKAGSATGDFELAGTVRGIDARVCWDNDREWKGTVWMQIRWELFASRQQRVVHSVTTEGSFSTDNKWAVLRYEEFYERAFVSALKNALADADMSQWLRADATKLAAAPSTPLAPLKRLVLALQSGSEDKPEGDLSAQRSSVVTVLSGAGSGSGFYIDADGYVLTNHHVVGDAKYVKVRLASGRDLVGEVLRSHAGRDVALLKTESVALRPFRLAIKPPVVGEEVMVIGSPFGDTFAGNVAKGVLSGSSTVREQKFWQSNVQVLPGSSGSPLMRRDGAVVGIAMGGVGVVPGTGVSLFVPIDEALGVLAIDFKP